MELNPPPARAATRLRLPSANALLAAIAALILLSGLTAYVFLAWTDYQDTVDEAERSLTEIAQLMEEHTQAVLQINQIQLQRVADLIGDRPLAALKGSEADWKALNGILARSPMGHSMWIFDANADLMLSSVKPSGMVLNVKDREYFSALVNSQDRFFVSPLITGRLTGGLLFPLAMRLTGPNGQFLGVAALSIRAEYFLDFYRELRPEASSAFALLRRDGAMVLRWPNPEQSVPTSTALSSRLFTTMLPKSPTGNYRSVSVIDGVDRLFAYRALPDYGLVVVTGMGADAVLEGWIDRTLRNGIFALVGLTVILGLAIMAARSARAEAQALARYEQKASALATALADKDVLFQEIHHRVKNNLQIVSSMLMMQSMQVKDDTTREALQQSLDRIHSMGLVHQTLYLSNEAAQVDMGTYLGSLAASLDASYGAADRGIALTVAADEGGLNLDQAVPLGLLANEALTNALKHAFPAGRQGHITIGLRRAEDLVRFFIEDDGQGLAAASRDGVGLTLIRALARQLDGELAIEGESGTRLALSFRAR